MKSTVKIVVWSSKLRRIEFERYYQSLGHPLGLLYKARMYRATKSSWERLSRTTGE